MPGGDDRVGIEEFHVAHQLLQRAVRHDGVRAVLDVRIREQTKNRMGLEDALNGILKAGGSINDDWDIEKTLTTADKATGTNVLMNLYRETRDKPAPVDLDQLWQKLGIAVKDGKVVYNDKAPEANIRKAITTARSPQR